MSLSDYQKEVDEWAQQFETPYWSIQEQFNNLVEEVGELGREMNHKYGIKKKKDSEEGGSLEEQLVEIIFPIICMANSKGIDLDKEWNKMMKERHYRRDNKRFERKNS